MRQPVHTDLYLVGCNRYRLCVFTRGPLPYERNMHVFGWRLRREGGEPGLMFCTFMKYKCLYLTQNTYTHNNRANTDRRHIWGLGREAGDSSGCTGRVTKITLLATWGVQQAPNMCCNTTRLDVHTTKFAFLPVRYYAEDSVAGWCMRSSTAKVEWHGQKKRRASSPGGTWGNVFPSQVTCAIIDAFNSSSRIVAYDAVSTYVFVYRSLCVEVECNDFG